MCFGTPRTLAERSAGKELKKIKECGFAVDCGGTGRHPLCLCRILDDYHYPVCASPQLDLHSVWLKKFAKLGMLLCRQQEIEEILE